MEQLLELPVRYFSVLNFISVISMDEIHTLFSIASKAAYREGPSNTLRMLLALWLQCLHIFLLFVHNFEGVKDRKSVGISWLSPPEEWIHARQNGTRS